METSSAPPPPFFLSQSGLVNRVWSLISRGPLWVRLHCVRHSTGNILVYPFIQCLDFDDPSRALHCATRSDCTMDVKQGSTGGVIAFYPFIFIPPSLCITATTWGAVESEEATGRAGFSSHLEWWTPALLLTKWRSCILTSPINKEVLVASTFGPIL